MSDDFVNDGDHDEPTIGGDAALGRPDTKPRNGWVIGLGVFALIAVAGIAALASGLFATTDETSLQVIPDDADLAITVDIRQFAEGDRLNRLIRAFSEPAAAAGHIEDAEVDLAALIDAELQQELGLSLEDDVLSWVGASLSAGMWAPSDGAFESTDFLVALDVRDRDAASAFLDVVVGRAEEEGAEFETSTLEGGTLISDTNDSGDVWLGDDYLMVSNDVSNITAGLSARSGSSIVDDEGYRRVMDELADDWLVGTYLSPDLYDDMATTAADLGAGPAVEPLAGLQGMGFSVSLNDNGLQVDWAQVHDGESSMMSGIDFDGGDLVAALPDDTLAFVGYSVPEGYVDEVVAPLRDLDPVAFEEYGNEFEEMFGVDLFEELIPSLTGDILLAAVESSDGLIAAESAIPIGVLLGFELNDSGPLSRVLEGAESMLVEDGLEFTGDDPRVVLYEGQEAAAYAIEEGLAVLGTSESVVAEFTAGRGGVTETDLYRRLDGALNGDGLSTYVDVGAILDLVPMTSDDRAIAAPLRGVGGVLSSADGVLTGSFLFLVDY